MQRRGHQPPVTTASLLYNLDSCPSNNSTSTDNINNNDDDNHNDRSAAGSRRSIHR